MAARGFLGSGDVFIERIVGGVPLGLKGPYYAEKFEIKPNNETKEMTSKGRDDYGQVIESVVLQQAADFTLDLREVNKESIALALLGSATSSSKAAGIMADKPVVIKKDTWVEVGHQNLGPSTVVEDVAGVTTYLVGTDYQINRQLGLIKVLAGSAIADGVTLHLSGAYAEISATIIAGSTDSDVRARIVFDGVNRADGLPVIVRVAEAVIAANSAFDFLADDFNAVSLPGKLKTPAGQTAPYTVELRDAQA